jgi:hypothetical protein
MNRSLNADLENVVEDLLYWLGGQEHKSWQRPCFQCCQLLTKLFGKINQKIRPLAKKFGPLENILINANITVFYTLFLSAKGTKNQRYEEIKCTFLQIFKLF